MSAQTFDTRGEDDLPPIDAINVTPLVDVMLVLLVVFLVTLPPLFQSSQLQLPKADAAAMQQRAHVDLHLGADGAMRWEQSAISVAELQSRLQTLAREQPQTQLRIWADAQVPYEQVAQVLAAAQRAQFAQLAFVTAPGPTAR